MRVVFMGTPHFAVPALEALCGHAAPGRLWLAGLDIVGVVTRPDKPAGRGRALAESPVKQFAATCGIPVLQPGPLRRPAALDQLRQLAPDLIVVSAFGQLLPPEVLSLPRHGCLNVHASLLPRHRGASPVAAAILAGDAQTGISIMLMDAGLDTGPILAQRALPIAPHESAGELTARLATLGGELLIETLPLWLAQSIVPTAQDATRATNTHLLRKADGRLDWDLPASELMRHIRAYTPAPGAFTNWQGHLIKVSRASVLVPADDDTPGEPGTLYLARTADGETLLACACGEEALSLEVLQLEGKRALPAAEFLRGHPAIVGARLGAPEASSIAPVVGAPSAIAAELAEPDAVEPRDAGEARPADPGA